MGGVFNFFMLPCLEIQPLFLLADVLFAGLIRMKVLKKFY